MQLQQFLKLLGYYKGAATGVLDEITRGAVKIFQSNNGLKADGEVDSKTWNMLLNIFMPGSVQIEVIENHPVRYASTPPMEVASDTPDVTPAADELKMGNLRNDNKKYSVVYGDSLFKIAKRFGTTVDDLKEKNGLRGDSLTVGQILNI